jgi:mannose-6-phosphate isomerase-like protein (cupin superfamily)
VVGCGSARSLTSAQNIRLRHGIVATGGETWHVKPGTFVKVPAYKEHSATNNGTEDLVFLVIYDPSLNDNGTP